MTGVRWLTAGLLALSLLLSYAIAYPQGIVVGPDGKSFEATLSLPYAFYNEKFGAAAAYVYGAVGYPQKQAAMLMTAMAGTQGSGMVFFIGNNIQAPFLERLFLDPIASVGYFSDNISYISGNPDFVGDRAGTNDSDEDNHVEGDGWDNYMRVMFKYLLPIGNGRDQIISTYVLDRGLLQSGAQGGGSWNPISSGKTYLQLRPFYRDQRIENDDVDIKWRTNGLDLGVYWDNRDLPMNPSVGSSWRFKVSRDFGAFDSSDSWTALEGEIDKYFSLGPSARFRQRVIALDVWTAYSPTWDEQDDGMVKHRPPAYVGANLGGLWKMRGYPSMRFSDRAAIYYCGELRMTPEWNPFNNWRWIQKYLGVQWVQFAPFVEIGRVAPEWNIDTLHSSMKWDVGVGFRMLAKGIVVRIDPAVSDEGFNVQMIISQSFQF